MQPKFVCRWDIVEYRRTINMKKAWKKIPKEIDYEKEEQLQQEPLEKGDIPAMLLASILSIFLPVIVILLLLIGICYLLFVGL